MPEEEAERVKVRCPEDRGHPFVGCCDTCGGYAVHNILGDYKLAPGELDRLCAHWRARAEAGEAERPQRVTDAFNACHPAPPAQRREGRGNTMTPLCAHFGYTGSLSCSCQCCMGTCGHAAQWFWRNYAQPPMYPIPMPPMNPSVFGPHPRCDCHECTQARVEVARKPAPPLGLPATTDQGGA